LPGAHPPVALPLADPQLDEFPPAPPLPRLSVQRSQVRGRYCARPPARFYNVGGLSFGCGTGLSLGLPFTALERLRARRSPIVRCSLVFLPVARTSPAVGSKGPKHPATVTWATSQRLTPRHVPGLSCLCAVFPAGSHRWPGRGDSRVVGLPRWALTDLQCNARVGRQAPCGPLADGSARSAVARSRAGAPSVLNGRLAGTLQPGPWSIRPIRVPMVSASRVQPDPRQCATDVRGFPLIDCTHFLDACAALGHAMRRADQSTLAARGRREWLPFRSRHWPVFAQ